MTLLSILKGLISEMNMDCYYEMFGSFDSMDFEAVVSVICLGRFWRKLRILNSFGGRWLPRHCFGWCLMDLNVISLAMMFVASSLY